MTFEECIAIQIDCRAKIRELNEKIGNAVSETIESNARFKVGDDVVYNGRKCYVVSRGLSYSCRGVTYGLYAYKKDGTRGLNSVGSCINEKYLTTTF